MPKNSKLAVICAAAALMGGGAALSIPVLAHTAPQQQSVSIKAVKRLNPTAVEVLFADNSKMTVDLYGPNIFRMFMDPKGGIVRNPKATPEADILVGNPRRSVDEIKITNENGKSTISTSRIAISFNNSDGSMTVTDLADGKKVLTTVGVPRFADGKAELTIEEKPGEYFYGGGVQNGRFSHKGRKIAIENQNSWTDGGVCSPAPYYWTTGGYGLMWHTFAPGLYDFGATEQGRVNLRHDTDYLDLFVTVNDTPVRLLGDYFQLTGNPVLLPKFGFYEGHLNAYNRDYWKPDTTGKGILFEDGKRYKESQKNNGGIRESLNGELPGNYQFSARAVVDRYLNADMPLGWVLPNDGYGAGYGQTSTLDGNIENLRKFGEYARSKGVEIGLWTQSDLHPKDSIEALLQRDIVKEVRDAGVRVLKTDVAWVGYGYSFGLNGVADVAQIMPYYGNDARPFIISLDGWAGTQRYAGIWSGDQTGGEWEYIRFHIPTYIGSGLAGNPNITSDMDGIFGGNKPIINTRDFQWKTFTPMQLNMDGWGYAPKYPQAMGEPYTSINRHYLKLKSELMPYAYTYAREAVDGKPLIRAMFLDYPSDFTHGTATRYQYLYGPDFLVAPVYQATAADTLGNDIRHGIYLPQGEWVDYFNGDVYRGNRIINYFDAPLWKVPVFVRRGAIIPMNNPHNNPAGVDRALRIFELYPALGTNSMAVYDDDGLTEQYRNGTAVTTPVSMTLDAKGILSVNIDKSTGNYDGFVPEQVTELRINATKCPKSVEALVGGKKVKLARFENAGQLGEGSGWYYDAAPELNRFATPGSEFAAVKITKNPQIVVRIAKSDVAANSTTVKVKGYELRSDDPLLKSHGAVSVPAKDGVNVAVGPYSVTPRWSRPAGADYCEIEFGGQLYSTLTGDSITIADLTPATRYDFRLRGVNADGPGQWLELSATTKDNPLEFAIHGLKGRSSVPCQDGFEVPYLFDFSEADMIWHTEYQVNAMPCDLTIDLGSVNNIDRLQYLPRVSVSHGTILEGTASYSMDGENWSAPVEFKWTRDLSDHIVKFEGSPKARFVRLHITKGVGNYASGREIYVFRTPGTESYIQGDINKDGKLDDNDLTSYMNYTGLKRGDADFEYVSIGDVNGNGLIDAYDISMVATTLDGGVQLPDSAYSAPVKGKVLLEGMKKPVAAGEEFSVVVRGKDLENVNAFSFALPYNASDWEYVKAEAAPEVAGMVNLTYDRLHTDGSKVLYPTFVNRGEKAPLNGNLPLVTLTFKARKRGVFTPAPTSIQLVGPNMRTAK